MAQTLPTRSPEAYAAPPPGRTARRLPASGLIPAGILVACTAALLHRYEVPFRVTALFGGYVAVGVTLPGTLLWRALAGGRFLVVQLAAGTALGYTLEVPAYVLARWLGAPRLFLAWPVLTVAAFAVVPRLRRHWTAPCGRVPTWWSWTVSALIGGIVVWSCRMQFHYHGLSWPGNAAPNLDLTYHLALVGELRHHLPPTTPWVLGEPLLYHWFVSAELAATSWATGLDPQVLLLRLAPLPMIAAFVVLVAAVGRKLTARWWPGIAALLVSYLLVAPSPHPGIVSADHDLAQLRISMWVSPTQTFGALLFTAAVLLVIDLLRGRARGVSWIPLSLLLVGVMGGKATYLPLLVAGLGCVLVLGPVRGRRRATATAAVLILVSAALMCFAQFVLFGGVSQGMTVDPAAALRYAAVRALPDGVAARPVTTLTMLVLGWCCVWAGVAGLLRRRSLTDPAVVLLLGVGGAGMVAMLLLSQPGGSQLWFSRAASTYLALAAMCGLSGLLPGRRATRPFSDLSLLLTAAVVAVTGAAVAVVFRGYADADTDPVVAFVALLTVTGCAAMVVHPVIRRWTGSGRLALAATVVLFTGLSLPASVEWHRTVWRTEPPAEQIVTRGAVTAGRWLRAHSAPDDVVATNAHCAQPEPPCMALHFWISGFAERRVLVEGWGYTAASNERAKTFTGRYTTVPFWDRRLLADNDAAFHAPSAATINLLRSRHRVRWLFADGRVPGLSPRIGDFAALRFRAADCAVYEITG